MGNTKRGHGATETTGQETGAGTRVYENVSRGRRGSRAHGGVGKLVVTSENDTASVIYGVCACEWNRVCRGGAGRRR